MLTDDKNKKARQQVGKQKTEARLVLRHLSIF